MPSDPIRETTRKESLSSEARRLAEMDATLYGTGYLLVRADGSVQRIDPSRIVIRPEDIPYVG